MKKLIHLTCVVLCLLVSLGAVAEDRHAETQIISSTIDGKEYFGLHVKLDEGWHIYWRSPGASGMKTSISPAQDNLSPFTITEVLWPFPAIHKGFNDEISYIYEDEVIIPFTINSAAINGLKFDLSYAVCHEFCIPVNESLTYHQANNQETQLLGKFLRKVPHVAPDNGLYIQDVALHKQELIVNVKSDQPLMLPELIIEGPEGVVFSQKNLHEAADKLSGEFYLTIENPRHVELTKTDLRITLTNRHAYAFETTIKPHLQGQKAPGLLVMLIIALVGGFILNLMPCVLPILSLKLIDIINKSNMPRQEIRRCFMATSLGIISCFSAIGLVSCIMAALGKTAGLGLNFQQPVFVIFIILILLFFAINLLGEFEINLPSWLGDILSNSNNSSHFFSGILACLIATPCSAPLVGTAISFALTRGYLEIMSIFTMMGIGLALPYILMSFIPSLVKYLPKSGCWMLTAKKILACLLLITIVWLLLVIYAQLGFLAAILLFLICLLLKFSLSINSSRPAFGRVMVLVLVGLAFILPLQTASDDKKYDNYVNAIWHKFDYKQIAPLLAEGKVVLVDVTADWCLTCKVNKIMVLDRVDVLNYLKSNQIIAMRADITSANPEVSAYMKHIKRFAIPINVIYGPGAPHGIILSELLTKHDLLNAISKASKK